VKYTLTNFQLDLMTQVLDRDAHKLIGIWGGIGCGKSLGLVLALHTVATTRPGSVSLMVSDTDNNIKNTLHPECVKVFGDDAEFIGPPHNKWQFKNGSIVQVRAYKLHSTLDESQNPIEGRNINGLIVVDEVQKIKQSVFVHAISRARTLSVDLTGRQYQPKIIFNGRPGAIDWWIKKVGAAGGKIFRPITADNLEHLGPDYLEDQKIGRTYREWRCICFGDPMPVKGGVYEAFEDATWPAGNVIDFRPNRLKPVSLGLDFGFRFPHVVFVQTVELIHPTAGRVSVDVVFDELTPDDCMVSELVRHIRAKRHQLSGAAVDPAGRARNAQTSLSDIDILRRSPDTTAGGSKYADHLGGGLGCRIDYVLDSARRVVEHGIQQVQASLCDANQVRRLVFSRELIERGRAAPPGTRTMYACLLQYSWDHVKRKKSGRSLGKDDPSHGADALRYWVLNYSEGSRRPPLPRFRPPTPGAVERAHHQYVNEGR